MTQKEIDKFLANTKVYVNGKSKEIQEKLFSFGYKWCGDYGTDISFIDRPFIYINDNRLLTHGKNMQYFTAKSFSEISTEEILSLELTEPTYRPFKDEEECWNEMLKHQPFGWLRNKKNGVDALIGNICQGDEVWITFAIDEKNDYSASDLFNYYIFTDGTPFGTKED